MSTQLLTIDELLRESNLIEGFDDIRYDRQAKVAWAYLQSVDTLNMAVINRVQKTLTQLQPELKTAYRGATRKIPVYIAGNEPVKPEFVKAALKQWIKIEPTIDPRHAHILYESIHPHVDGNGRTGRILLWWRELKAGQPYTQITDDKKFYYYRWFKPGYEHYAEERGELYDL